ncbi:hypothetical protein [Bacillus sp. AFS055030]|uniref:hypothetical protein n=1 Tax=Bacillus sp. AFS055030 TaxID=2033507 RepID=UPI000BFB7C13|nr:hypothetical protein [Bacillus sp. AFS055030]PGL72500.1 hypothetical protein CN925_03880 [Bacillus sp. AFS055030]
MTPFGDLHNDFGGIAFALGWLIMVVPFAFSLIFITREMVIGDEERLEDEIKQGVHDYARSYKKTIKTETKTNNSSQMETPMAKKPLFIKLAGLIVSVLITYVTVKGIVGDGGRDLTSIGLVLMWSLFFLTQGVLWWVVTSQGKQDFYQDVTNQRRM